MAQQLINVGTTANDGTGDLLRNGFIKVNQNFTELYTNRISGSGTDNYIPRFNGTNALENSIIFDSGTNVGIGTSSPSAKLDVSSGNINLSNSFNLTGRNNANTLNIALIGRNSTDRIIIDADGYGTNIGGGGSVLINPAGGNVGIGTASPSSLLEIAGSAPILTMNRTSGSFVNTIDFKTSGSSVASIISNAGNGEQRYSIGPSVGWGGFHTFYTDTNERMRITSAGNVGIGTSNPEVKLDIYGTGTTQHRIQSSSGGDIRFSVDSVGRLGTYSNSDFLLLSNGTERMRITSGGNVGIGTTNPTEKLHVAGVAQILDDGSRGRITFQISSTQNDLYSTTTAFDDYRNLRLSSNELILSSGGTTERMRITSSGNVGIGTTSPNEKLSISSTDEYLLSWIRSGNSKKWAFGADSGGTYFSNRTDSVLPLYITNAGNVGIGTSSPSAKLDVKGNAIFNNATNSTDGIKIISSLASSLFTGGIEFFRDTTLAGSKIEPLRDAGSGGVGLNLLVTANNSAEVSGTYSNAMTILPNGNVGIGTTTPFSNAKLQIRPISDVNIAFQPSNGLSNGGKINAFDDAASVNVNLEFNGLNLGFKTNESERMRITSAGNVGIGTTSPNEKLSILGNIELEAGSNRYIKIGSASNYHYNLQSVGDDFQILEAGTTPRLTIKYPSGNVGIGTTSPTSKLQVVGLPSYVDNTTALAGGLTAGAFYHTAGVLKVVI